MSSLPERSAGCLGSIASERGKRVPLPRRPGAIKHGHSVEYFRDEIFNYTTIAEAYKVAALDGLNRIA